MYLRSKTISILVNLLLGACWAFAFLGAFSAFAHFSYAGAIYGIAMALLWSLPGLFGVVVLEYMLAGFVRTEEVKKQTKLIERFLKNGKEDFPER
jgi:uncharacterized membrane protein